MTKKEIFEKAVIISQDEGDIGMDEYPGICHACGEVRSGVEPDAREYECEECGAHAVYGIEETIIMLAGTL